MTLTARTLSLLTATGLSLALTACGGGGGGGGSSEGGGGGSSGGETSYAGPIQSTDVALGQQRDATRCGNACHNSGGGPALANIGWTAERTRRQIREGSGVMAAIGRSGRELSWIAIVASRHGGRRRHRPAGPQGLRRIEAISLPSRPPPAGSAAGPPGGPLSLES